MNQGSVELVKILGTDQKTQQEQEQKSLNEVVNTIRKAYPNDSINVTVPKVKIGKICTIAGRTVWKVDGKYIRDNIEIDFTQGGNSGRYAFIPKNEIWIDKEVDKSEIDFTIFHEVAEEKLMGKGLPYEQAHEKAAAFESAMRGDREMQNRFNKLLRVGYYHV